MYDYVIVGAGSAGYQEEADLRTAVTGLRIGLELAQQDALKP